MKILNLGSLNIDRVYSVEHFVQAGETISAGKMDVFCGGKGLNQSIALARAGMNVWHAGAVGEDGGELLALLREAGAETGMIRQRGEVSGHAIIQLTPEGENCIIVCPGSNGQVSREYIDEVLAEAGPEDWLLLQNEISNLAYAMERAKEKGMTVVLNPSPITAELLEMPLSLANVLILNEVEGRALGGCQETEYSAILAALHLRFPATEIVLTVGEQGVYYQKGDLQLRYPIYPVETVDATGAGDTFCGYFVAGRVGGESAEEALRTASMAAAIAVSRKGAAPSIPTREEVLAFAAGREGKEE